jgi:hypothetical protein
VTWQQSSEFIYFSCFRLFTDSLYLGDFHTYLHLWPPPPSMKLDTEVHSLLNKIWTEWVNHFHRETLTLVFVQVSPFSLSELSDIFRLRPIGRVGSPASLLSTTMVTSLLVSSTFLLGLAFPFKLLSGPRFARRRMTTRLLQLLPCRFNLVSLPCFHSGSGSVEISSIYMSSHLDSSEGFSSDRCVKSCHRDYLIFTYHYSKILDNFQTSLRSACTNPSSLYVESHSGRNAQVDLNRNTLNVRLKRCIRRNRRSRCSCGLS